MAVEKAEPMDAPTHSPQPPARVRHPMVEANIGESSHPAVPARRFSRDPARARERARRPDIAAARLPRSRSRSADRPAPARRLFAPPGARGAYFVTPRSIEARNSSSKLTARFFPPFPKRSALSRPARREALAPRRPAGPMERSGRLRRRQGAPPRLWRHGRRPPAKVRRG